MALEDEAAVMLETLPEPEQLVIRKLLARVAGRVDEMAPISTRGL
jgi:hypothetical protein